MVRVWVLGVDQVDRSVLAWLRERVMIEEGWCPTYVSNMAIMAVGL